MDSLFDPDWTPPDEVGRSVLALKPRMDGDDPDDSTLPARVSGRKDIRHLNFLDVDHDGRATEFLLQVGTMPCGKRLTRQKPLDSN